jgi:thioredoxin 1
VKHKGYVIGGAVTILAAVAALFYMLRFGNGTGQALATVNGEKITVQQFLQDVVKIQEPDRSMLREDPAKFLDMMIMKALILQEVRREGFQASKEERGEEEVIQEFLQKKFSSPPAVSKEELAAFYETYKDRMEGQTLEQAAPMIEQVIRQGKQEEEYMRFLEEIRTRASVEINQERLKAMRAKAPESTNTGEDFSKALKSGRPVLVDFGSNSCIPCRQLRPILQEIRKEQAGKMEVLVIDVYKYQDLANEFRIQVIPTIILFDSNAKEVFRHQGFMPKAAIMEQTRKVGVS